MWINNISEIIYRKCLKDDKKEYWSLITDDRYIYEYCDDIGGDNVNLYNRLTDEYYIHCYHEYIQNNT